MKTNVTPLASLIVAGFLATTSIVMGQGSLTPPGSPTPTMKTLDQIEARTAITAAHFNITQPGSYYLANNLTVTTGDAIVIMTNNVTLDLNGFTITSVNPSPSGYAIHLSTGLGSPAVQNITIFNGFITGGATNDSTGAVGGPGFVDGIGFITANQPVNVRVHDLSVSGFSDYGINLGNDYSSVAEDCTVRTCWRGIQAGVVNKCTVTSCDNGAIIGRVVSDCYATSVGTAINAYTVINSMGTSSGQSFAVGIQAEEILNSHGSSTSTGRALQCVMAQNSYAHGEVLAAGTVSYLYVDNPSGIAITAPIGVACTIAAGTTNITYKYLMP